MKGLVPDRTGLHDLALLNAVGKHPVFILRFPPLLQRKHTLNVCFRQQDRAIGAVVLRRMQLKPLSRLQ